MITSNPFADLSATIPSFAMQAYVIAMFLLVIGGTVLDMIHKKSAKYFLENAKKSRERGKTYRQQWRKSIHGCFDGCQRSADVF